MGRQQTSVLIAIDMQCAFDLPGRPRRGNMNMDANGLQLLAAWRAHRQPIIHVRNDDPAAGSWFHKDHPGHAFRAGFSPQAAEALIAKSVNSAFIGTDLDLRLRRLGATGIVLFGMRTDMCVSSTARCGSNIGWDVTVIADASDCCDIADPFGGSTITAEEAHRVHLATIAEEFGRVTSTRTIVGELL